MHKQMTCFSFFLNNFTWFCKQKSDPELSWIIINFLDHIFPIQANFQGYQFRHDPRLSMNLGMLFLDMILQSEISGVTGVADRAAEAQIWTIALVRFHVDSGWVESAEWTIADCAVEGL